MEKYMCDRGLNFNHEFFIYIELGANFVSLMFEFDEQILPVKFYPIT